MKLLFDHGQVAAGVVKMVDAVAAEFADERLDRLAMLGVQSNGVPLANRMRDMLAARTGRPIDCGAIDITMHRDDFGMRRELRALRETIIDFDINERYIVLVDDVLSSGRTIRAALDLITDYGRPNLIRLAVLVDRGFREYPICADYIGLEYHGDTTKVKVKWDGGDGQGDGVYLKTEG